MSEQLKLKVIVDDRERKLMKFLDLNEESIEYECAHLDIADIVFSEDTAAERKEGNDFISSIKDNRLFEQLLRLKECYSNAILILEGLNDKVLNRTNMRLSSIYAILAKISYVMGIAVISTRNLEDTVILIERIAYREQIKKGETLFARSNPKGMSKEDRKIFIVEGLINCGPKKAKELIQVFGTPYNVFKAIKKTNIVYTRAGNPKGIEGPIKDVGLTGFNWKFIQENKPLICDIEDTFSRIENYMTAKG